MHLRGLILLLGIGVVVISHSTDGMSFDRDHVIRRRDADPDVNYDDEVMADAANDDDTQNDADLDEDKEEPGVDLGTIDNTGELYILKMGQTVRLPCKVSHSDPVIQWEKNKELLFLGSTKTTSKASYILDKSDLIVKDVKAEDEGVYNCSIPGTDESVQHTIKVTMPAKVIDLNATNNGVVVEGQKVIITCTAEGTPPPVLIWSKQANNENVRLTEKDVEFTANSIILNKIRADQEGVYFCYADNKLGSSRLDAKSIHVKVVGKPMVHVHKKVINTRTGVEAVLQCTAHRQPESHIKWYKDGRPVADVEDLFTISTAGQSSNLTIIPRVDRDFGTYTCIAENMYGKHEKSIMLVQRPTIEDIDSDGPKLSWTIQSYLPLKEIELQVGSKNGSTTQTIDLPVPESVFNKPHKYHMSHEVTNLEPGNYWANIRASNEHGWSEVGHSEVEIAMSEPIIHGAAFGGRGDAQSVRPTSVLLSSALMYILIRFF